MKRKSEFWSFKKARAYVRNLKIMCQKDWVSFCSRSGLKPKQIPATPYNIYKNNGWIGWKDWLNHNRMVGGKRKYTINEDYFKTWSHDMAYIFGFWFTDGNIDAKRGNFSITQHINDQYLLKEVLLKMGINSEPKQYSNKNCSIIQVSSRKMVEDIIALGGKPAKSLDCIFPVVPVKYLPDFIRGLWDGDGCISNQKWRGYNYYRASFSCGSKLFIDKFKEIINKNIPLTKGFISIKVQKRGTMINGCQLSKDSIVYELCLGINDTRRLRDYIYQNKGLKMARKYEKFLEAGAIKFSKPVTTVDYKEAQKYASSLKLRSKTEWFKYIKLQGKPTYIPANPSQRYSGKGWINWYHWLGKEK